MCSRYGQVEQAVSYTMCYYNSENNSDNNKNNNRIITIDRSFKKKWKKWIGEMCKTLVLFDVCLVDLKSNNCRTVE